jgi:hypothetical protein
MIEETKQEDGSREATRLFYPFSQELTLRLTPSGYDTQLPSRYPEDVRGLLRLVEQEKIK